MNTMKKYAGMKPLELLEALNLSGPPFDPFEIIRQLGIELEDDLTRDKLNYSGTIRAENGNVHIWINPLDVQYRRRFTAAHELGHLINDILPQLEPGTDLDGFKDRHARGGAKNKVERLADSFAAQLLMPGQMVVDAATAHLRAINDDPKAGSVTQDQLTVYLARLFNVSKQAMAIRLRNIGIH